MSGHIVKKLGSFPNSQIKPRSPVRNADMINIDIPLAGGEVQILSKNDARVKAIVRNSGDNSFKIDYTSGPSDGMTIDPRGALVIDGGGDDVFVTAIGGDTSVEIDDRVG